MHLLCSMLPSRSKLKLFVNKHNKSRLKILFNPACRLPAGRVILHNFGNKFQPNI